MIKVLLGLIISSFLLSGCLFEAKKIESTIEPVEIPFVSGEKTELVNVLNSDNSISLSPVFGESGSGFFNIEKKGGNWLVQIIADLPELEEGYFYEAWLSSDYEGVLYLSKLERRKGGWVMSYETEDDLSDFGSVIITRESKDDQKQEARVLEGRL